MAFSNLSSVYLFLPTTLALHFDHLLSPALHRRVYRA
jgi:hypothetical protein